MVYGIGRQNVVRCGLRHSKGTVIELNLSVEVRGIECTTNAKGGIMTLEAREKSEKWYKLLIIINDNNLYWGNFMCSLGEMLQQELCNVR